MSVDRLETAETVRAFGSARGLHWTAKESQAIAEQLRDAREGLRAAASRIDASGEEPASSFSPAWEGRE